MKSVIGDYAVVLENLLLVHFRNDQRSGRIHTERACIVDAYRTAFDRFRHECLADVSARTEERNLHAFKAFRLGFFDDNVF